MKATRVRRLRIRKAIGRSTFVGCMLAAGVLYLALEKNIMLVVEGRPVSVRTTSGSVGELLEGEGITLEPGDQVEPPLGTILADGMTVVVDLGEVGVPEVSSPLLSDSAGVTSVGVWVMEGVSGPILQLAAQPTENWFSADASAGLSRIVEARVVVKGKEHDVLTIATTVRELLSAMGITPDRDDRVQPSPSTPLQPNQLIRYVDLEVRTRMEEAVLPFRTTTMFSNDLRPGEVDVLRPGVPGRVLRTTRVRIVDGKVVSRRIVAERILVSPITARRVVGFRENGTSGSAVGEGVWYDAPGSGYTAAHLTLPFGTRVMVTNLDNGRSVTVVINDRGPYGGRLIDLSPEAFSAIAPLGQGVAQVRITW